MASVILGSVIADSILTLTARHLAGETQTEKLSLEKRDNSVMGGKVLYWAAALRQLAI
jgi:hypothetical protein